MDYFLLLCKKQHKAVVGISPCLSQVFPRKEGARHFTAKKKKCFLQRKQDKNLENHAIHAVLLCHSVLLCPEPSLCCHSQQQFADLPLTKKKKSYHVYSPIWYSSLLPQFYNMFWAGWLHCSLCESSNPDICSASQSWSQTGHGTTQCKIKCGSQGLYASEQFLSTCKG